MRVPTLQTARDAFDSITAKQADQARLQSRVASGLRVQSPGDDPVAAAQAEMARARLSAITQDKRANSLATSVLSAADTALGQGVDLLQGVREHLVAAGDGSYSPADRASLAQQLTSYRDQLLALANTSDGAGGFVFGGQGAASAPLSGVAQPAYAPDAGEQRIGEGGRYAATVDGGPAFMNIPQGNGVFVTASAAGNTGSAWIGAGNVTSPAQLTGHSYSITIAGAPGAQTYTVMDTTASTTVVPATAFKPGEAIAFAGQQVTISGTPAAGDSFSLQPTSNQSVFKTLDDAITLLKNGTLPKPQYNEQLERVQSSLDRALDGMVLARSRVGTQLQATDSGAASNSQQEVAATQRHSDLVDMDVVQGLSELQSGQTALQAALQSYAAIGRTSLFELLR